MPERIARPRHQRVQTVGWGHRAVIHLQRVKSARQGGTAILQQPSPAKLVFREDIATLRHQHAKFVAQGDIARLKHQRVTLVMLVDIARLEHLNVLFALPEHTRLGTPNVVMDSSKLAPPGR